MNRRSMCALIHNFALWACDHDFDDVTWDLQTVPTQDIMRGDSTRNSWYVFHYILRLEGSSEQEEVKQGVTYCIIIQEDQQIGSTSDCCIPKVGRWKSTIEEEKKMNNNIQYWKWKQGLTLLFRSQARHQVQKCAEQKWVDSLFQSLKERIKIFL